MTKGYNVPDGITEVVYEIKKSRFIARLIAAGDREQAMSVLALAKLDYPDARHHCWGYLIGPPTQPKLLAASDDGEPSGTAGKPILNVMQHKDVGDVMLVVIRYFGGIKLGAGGLVRAYSQAAQLAYENASTVFLAKLSEYRITCEFADEQTIRHWLSKKAGAVLDVQYSQQVLIFISLSDKYEQEFRQFLASIGVNKLSIR